MSYILTLTTESYLLTGSGEGGVLIDADVVFHNTGFPIIPARRLKGMLKESMEEILEIYGKPESEVKAVITNLFGESGKATYEGKLLFHNLMLPDWEQIAKEVATNAACDAFKPNFIKTYFTAEIQQTAIGREGEKGEIEGVAKKRSLRNYRVIKPEVSFEGLLETTTQLTQEEDTFLKRAVLNLRYAGTRRNRGFGKVKCKIETLQPKLSNNPKLEIEQSGKLNVTITTQSSVVLAEQLGEQNTVFTRKYIAGNQLRGLLANAFIREKSLSTSNAHLDVDFFDIFLSGKVHFGNLSFSEAQPIPLYLHKYKLDKTKEPISVFDKSDKDNEITKSVGGTGSFDGSVIKTNGFTPKTTFNFHNSRMNRAAGRSKEDDAETGIFYYESLNEGQDFHGEISGDSTLISKLAETLSEQFNAKLGRSRSAQYGSVSVKLNSEGQTDGTQSLTQGVYVMTLQSPLVLLNDYGVPMPTAATLSGALGSGTTVDKAAVAFTYVEQFNAVWQAKSDKVPAFKEGSSFLVSLAENTTMPEQLGEWTEQGFGRVKIEPYKSGVEYEIEEKIDNPLAPSENAKNVSSEIVRELLAAFNDENRQLEVKSNAIADAQKAKRINNHLIGRMERLFERSGSEREIFAWIKETQGKPAGDALKKPDLVDYDHRFDMRTSQENKGNWPLQKLYWLTFFQTLRKINKKNGKQ